MAAVYPAATLVVTVYIVVTWSVTENPVAVLVFALGSPPEYDE